MGKKSSEFDYIIVGSGSAGSVVAHRLSTDPANRVLVLEAGGKDRSIYIHMPAAFSEPLKNNRLNWSYYTLPEPYMDHRKMYCPRGRVIGGCSSINGMVYIRGHARDYDRWAGYGLEDWDYSHCLPYFRKVQKHEMGSNEYRGSEGLMHVTAGRDEHPLFKIWLEAGEQAGYTYTEDVNGYRQEGMGPFDRTTYKGERWSAAKAYLHPAQRRTNLKIQTRVNVQRVLFDGIQAKGVEFSRGSKLNRAYATREVILCAGAIHSPTLLQCSGVGPADLLKKFEISVVVDLPGVGDNLQDHLELYIQYECTQPITLYPAVRPFGRLKVGLEWIFFRTGHGATNHFEAGGFIRSRSGIEHPNLQYHFLPLAMSYDGSIPASGHGFQAHIGPVRPTSRGYVRIKSLSSIAEPEILYNYLGTENDRQEMRDAVRLTREIIAQKAFEPYRGKELAPGSDVQTDADIDAFVRTKGESAYHPVGSCKMGVQSDRMSVVDAVGQVYGVEKLRVVDASIMPDLVSGNTDAPTMMLAEKISDAILGNEPLPASNSKVWIHPHWQTQQR